MNPGFASALETARYEIELELLEDISDGLDDAVVGLGTSLGRL